MKPPKFMVVWRLADGTTKVHPHTAKPTALGHVKGLQRNPNVTAVVAQAVPQEET